MFQSTFHTLTGTLTCIGCPLAAASTAFTGGVSAPVAGAVCTSCSVISRTRREAVESAPQVAQDVPRTARMILQEADLNEDGVLDLTEAAEYLIFDGKLHFEV